MGRWDHAFCAGCWTYLYPGREPDRSRAAAVETCCRCGRPSGDGTGVYVFRNPLRLPCRGSHPEPAQGDEPGAGDLHPTADSP